ncbi:MAG: flagellar biosynthetic protein FliR [Ignavibacteriae bacterium]|nr:flagellar biosynthetic protein FliR [Ignavibacteriota bacterium]
MSEILVVEFLTGLMIFIRVSAMFVVAPIYNSNNIPVLVRLSLALIVSYIIFFNVGKYPLTENDVLLKLFLFGAKEVFTGVIMGITLNLVFQAISFAGLLIGRDMGLAMSQMFDPASNTDGNIISTVLTLAAIVIFVLINGHHFVIQSLSYSFKIIPIGGFVVNENAYLLLVKYSGSIFILAVKIASPIIVAFFLVHLASGIITRVSPSFQVFFVLLPLKLTLGIFLLALVTPLYVYLFKDLIFQYEEKLFEIVKAIGG